ncbi:uncharacterized protein LOC131023635 [Salvia miltiorrhiza]|uniref:uncharacterized protein LOC131023635 n=1 Tax=Salvia miltiorrhiza TaxID=226208 RepID=UPI0025ACE3F5|nr:uncharacterized protein LOC131023635 [Salvia miltiorrhiza]
MLKKLIKQFIKLLNSLPPSFHALRKDLRPLARGSRQAPRESYPLQVPASQTDRRRRQRPERRNSRDLKKFSARRRRRCGGGERGGFRTGEACKQELARVKALIFGRAVHTHCTVTRCGVHGGALSVGSFKRKIQIAVEERWCNACVTAEETVEHVLLHCPKTEQVWNNIQQWINIKTVTPRGLSQHFLSFIHASKDKRWRKFLKGLWIGTVWILWRCRNESRFQGKVWDVQKVTQEIIGRMWSWNSFFHIVDINFPFSLWCSNGLVLDSL